MRKSLTIRPYARLITMLGEQLIKNEIIALTELIKNSYDADASIVRIKFENIKKEQEGFLTIDESKIIIEDNGCGMNREILEKHWLNPATPEKLKRKKEKKYTQKNRILQGEKGIGRFAIFKLGKKIKITTRRQKKLKDDKFIEQGENIENTLIYDFSKYDADFLMEDGKNKDLYIDDLKVFYDEGSPEKITFENYGFEYGTIIEISDLKSLWTMDKLEAIQKTVGKLQPIFNLNKQKNDFSVEFYLDSEEVLSEKTNTYIEKLIGCLEKKTVLKITDGNFDSQNNKITYKENKREIELSFKDADIKEMSFFKEKFKDENYKISCGNFKFEFYIFDFNITTEDNTKYYLDNDEKKIIKEHRIYLYRDNIRVMPYGDSDDDWLKIDIIRGTKSARESLSNDQVVGCIYITEKENINLKDKTNREGLIDDGKALDDFINIIQLILRYIRKGAYARYLVSKKKSKEMKMIQEGKPLGLIEEELKKIDKEKDQKTYNILNKIKTSYRRESAFLTDKLKITEDLAGVGLSIETASHDLNLFMKKTKDDMLNLIKNLEKNKKINYEELVEKLTIINGNISMVELLLKDIRTLFPSSKRKTKNIRVIEIIEKVFNFYKRAFKDNNIECEIIDLNKPLIVKITDAVLLQVFINLFDNSLYWLKVLNQDRKIEIYIDGNSQKLIFSDNGPGIREEDKNYIFEAFYSGKGEEGRGLGLYIAKQLLNRYDYKIELAQFKQDTKLEGANFIFDFNSKE